MTHPSHVTRMSDASTFDEICTICGGTDRAGSRALDNPCPGRAGAVPEAVQAMEDLTEGITIPEVTLSWKGLINLAKCDLDKIVLIDYTNHRGERNQRIIAPYPDGWHHGTNEWHKKPGWLLNAYDPEKNADRIFAMRGMHSWKETRV